MLASQHAAKPSSSVRPPSYRLSHTMSKQRMWRQRRIPNDTACRLSAINQTSGLAKHIRKVDRIRHEPPTFRDLFESNCRQALLQAQQTYHSGVDDEHRVIQHGDSLDLTVRHGHECAFEIVRTAYPKLF